jgi:hypothetical protein
MADGMNSMNSMNSMNRMNSRNSFSQFTTNLIAHSAVRDKQLTCC